MIMVLGNLSDDVIVYLRRTSLWISIYAFQTRFFHVDCRYVFSIRSEQNDRLAVAFAKESWQNLNICSGMDIFGYRIYTNSRHRRGDVTGYNVGGSTFRGEFALNFRY